MNEQGAMDGFYRIATRDVAMFGERNVDCRHHDCVTQVLNGASVAAAGVTMGCTATGLIPCAFVAGAADRALTGTSVLWTTHQALRGNATAADVTVFAAMTKLATQGDPRLALGANLAQTIWDTFRRE